jgi:hypothetical protein
MNVNQRWWYHPTDNSVDVAVTPWSPPDFVECETIPIKMFVTDELIASQSLGAGDEVFIVGLFAPFYGWPFSPAQGPRAEPDPGDD